MWDAFTGAPLHALAGHGREVHAVTFSPDGKTLVSGSWDNTIRLWDVASGKLLHPFAGHDGVVNGLTVSGDGRMAASAGGDLAVRVWDLATRQQSLVLRGHTEFVYSVAFSPDGKLLASAAQDKTVRIWDVAHGKELHKLSVLDDVWTIAFSPDGTMLAGLSPNSSPKESLIQIWDPTTGKELRSFRMQSAMTSSVSFTPDGKALVIVGYEEVLVLEMATGKELRRLDYGQPLVCFPDGKRLAMHGGDLVLAMHGDDSVHVMDLETGRDLYAFPQENGMDMRFMASPDGFTMVRTSGVRQIRFWEVMTGKQCLLLNGHEGAVSCAAFTPDGRTLLTGSEDTSILVWDVTGQKAPAHVSKQGMEQLTPTEIRGCWADLAAEDATKAHRAMWKLVDAAHLSLPFIVNKRKPAAIVDAAKVQQWFIDLNSEEFTVRQAAAKGLEQTGSQVRPSVKKALQGNITLESRRRLEKISNSVSGVPGQESLRIIRAIMVLERIGSPQAQDVLETLARGAPGARETEEAKATLERLVQRASKLP